MTKQIREKKEIENKETETNTCEKKENMRNKKQE